ncbi:MULTISPECIES: LysR substrate-binding domain-containing protein [Pseudomonas]|uniref:LysR substrate-binding domain-containing protein n=1 Tax=Pseudomonas auratipiscis TaxID=3115853 RepID=A0AB35WQJ8_9PSED|nr:MULTISPECIES: LysR substrate-binding domain-containing protein [unclassified Pseudomonas]MEE1866687.1 LysR substrate-binding domain-containing protein [Pseudomonas sp. 120P]MEE1958583.1 LysR substrate-binding domain-containing protein [Pseudomonas sp. 119P]
MKSTVVSVARKLKLYQLVVFDQVLRSGSLVGAAQALNLTQPAVTKIIHELEAFLGAALLVRGNRGVRATELGGVVVRRAHAMLTELRSLTDEVNAYHSGTTGQVMVGSLTSSSALLVPHTLRLLKESAPGVLVTVRVGHMDQLFSSLLAGELDIVVGRIPDDWHRHEYETRLKVDVLGEEGLCVVAGAEHPLHRSSQPLSLADLHPFPWILPPRSGLLRRTVDRLFEELDLGPPVNVIESVAALTNYELIQDQQTISFFSLQTAQQLAHGGKLKAFDLGKPMSFGSIGCFYAANRNLDPAARLFKECLTLTNQMAANEAQAV